MFAWRNLDTQRVGALLAAWARRSGRAAAKAPPLSKAAAPTAAQANAPADTATPMRDRSGSPHG